MKVAVISKDKEYSSMLVYELNRRGFDTVHSETYGGADVALIDLDSLDANASVFGGVKIITFSYGDLATLKRPFSIDALANLLGGYQQTASHKTQLPIIDPQSGRIYYNGRDVALSPLEFSVFSRICAAQGNVVTFGELIAHFSDCEVFDKNRLRVCINSIRRKIRPIFGYDPIENQKSVGYRFNIV